MVLFNRPSAYIKPNSPFLKPAPGTQQAIVRQELDSYLGNLPPRVYQDVSTGLQAIKNQASEINSETGNKLVANLSKNVDYWGSQFNRKFEKFNDKNINPEDLVTFQAYVNERKRNNNAELQDAGKALATYLINPNGYLPINTGLQQTELTGKLWPSTDKPIHEAIRGLTRNVTDAVDTLPRYTGQVYRGVAIPTDVDINTIYQPGKTIDNEGFTSSTYRAKHAKDFAVDSAKKATTRLGQAHKPVELIIQSKHGRYTPNALENEILFQPQNRFQVQSIQEQNGIPVVTMTDLGTPIDRAVEYQDQTSNIGTQSRGYQNLIPTKPLIPEEAIARHPFEQSTEKKMIPLGTSRLLPQGQAIKQQQLADAALIAINGNLNPAPARLRAADMPPDPAPTFAKSPYENMQSVARSHQQTQQLRGMRGNNDYPELSPIAVVEISNKPYNMGLGEAIGDPSRPEYVAVMQSKVDEVAQKVAHPAYKLYKDYESTKRNLDTFEQKLQSSDYSPEQKRMLADMRNQAANKIRNLEGSINSVSQKYGSNPFFANAAPETPTVVVPPSQSVKQTVVDTPVVTSAPSFKDQGMSEDDYYDMEYQRLKSLNDDQDLLPMGAQGKYFDDMRSKMQTQNNIVKNAAIAGGVGLTAAAATGLINNALNSEPIATPIVPSKKAHFVIDKTNGTAQSFIDQGQGLQPYKAMSIDEARSAYSKAKNAGWGVSFE